jgi:hypothetical protein
VELFEDHLGFGNGKSITLQHLLFNQILAHPLSTVLIIINGSGDLFQQFIDAFDRIKLDINILGKGHKLGNEQHNIQFFKKNQKY